MGFAHLHTGANSTKTRWIVPSLHSGTLSLSHCKMLRISGESVSNHHGQINDSNTKQEDARRCKKIMHISKWDLLKKLNQDKVQEDHAYLEMGFAHLHTGANSTKTRWIVSSAIVVSLQDAQNQRGKRFKSSRAYTQERYRCLTARCSESAGKAFQIITGIFRHTSNIFLKTSAHFHITANSTNTIWRLTTMFVIQTMSCSLCEYIIAYIYNTAYKV